MVKNLPAMQETGFDPGVGTVCWRREQQPTPVYLPGKSSAQRRLVGCSPQGCKKCQTQLSNTHTHTIMSYADNFFHVLLHKLYCNCDLAPCQNLITELILISGVLSVGYRGKASTEGCSSSLGPATPRGDTEGLVCPPQRQQPQLWFEFQHLASLPQSLLKLMDPLPLPPAPSAEDPTPGRTSG